MEISLVKNDRTALKLSDDFVQDGGGLAAQARDRRGFALSHIFVPLFIRQYGGKLPARILVEARS